MYRTVLCARPYFALERWTAGDGAVLARAFATAQILSTAGAPVTVACGGWTGRLGRARTLLLPAALGQVRVTGPADVLFGYLPDRVPARFRTLFPVRGPGGCPVADDGRDVAGEGWEAAVGWRTEEFGESHEGIVGAVLEDGSEPKPAYLDTGGGPGMYRTSEWWAYDGGGGRPRAAGARASCSCGWRGPSVPVPRGGPAGDGLEDLDVSGPHRDWTEHVRTVERRTVPLPEDLAQLLAALEEKLLALAEDAPAAALRAVTALDRLGRRAGREAACMIDEDDGRRWEALGRALGIGADRARSLVTGYLPPH